MNREQLMKMSKKELKARLVTVGKEAQDKSGEELTALMDEQGPLGKSWTRLKPVKNLQEPQQRRQQREKSREMIQRAARVQKPRIRQERKAEKP